MLRWLRTAAIAVVLGLTVGCGATHVVRFGMPAGNVAKVAVLGSHYSLTVINVGQTTVDYRADAEHMRGSGPLTPGGRVRSSHREPVELTFTATDGAAEIEINGKGTTGIAVEQTTPGQ